MTHVAMVYRRPVGVVRQSVKPQLASWDRAGHPSQVKLRRFLAQVDAIAGPVLARVSGRVAAELIVGFDGVSLIDGGHDLDNYLFPVAQRPGWLGPMSARSADKSSTTGLRRSRHHRSGPGRADNRADDRAGPQLGQPVQAAHRRLVDPPVINRRLSPRMP
jgi:hypothetical protein